jgi:uncharacterized protein (TIGR00255 family)
VSELGDIEDDRLLQAKGRHYTLDALLAGRKDWVTHFRGGRFATIYLAPYNYHRIHMALPGVLRAESSELDEAAEEARRAVVAKAFTTALQGLAKSRAAEGARLAEILGVLIDEIAGLVTLARDAASDQPAQQKARLRESLAALLEGERRVPEERLAAEVALLAAKSDVREEIDRLNAHIAEARALLASGDAVGRRLEFLTQEFVREANTLCSKSATVALTRLGLDLKAAIERLREQAANVE